MERDLVDFDPNYIFESEQFFLNVKIIMNLNFFNRIKLFMIRLFRNNLFLGDKASKKMKNITQNCNACGSHPETHVELMMNCSRTNNLLQFLIKIMKKAGGLQRGCKIDMLMLKNYQIDSIENITLMFTWKHVYNSKYNKLGTGYDRLRG